MDSRKTRHAMVGFGSDSLARTDADSEVSKSGAASKQVKGQTAGKRSDGTVVLVLMLVWGVCVIAYRLGLVR